MEIIFDFDNTLFNTEATKQALYKIAMIHGFSLSQAKEIYVEARRRGDRIVISISSFIMTLKEWLKLGGKEFLADEVSQIILQLQKVDGFLPGAKEILQFCEAQNFSVFVLSLGVPDWQAEKARQCDLYNFVPKQKVIITEQIANGKIGEIEKLQHTGVVGENVIFWNDKPDETVQILNRFPQFLALVRRETRDDRYTEQDFIDLQNKFQGRVWWADNLPALFLEFKKLVY